MQQLVGSICNPKGLRRDAFFGVNDTNVEDYRGSLIIFPKLA